MVELLLEKNKQHYFSYFNLNDRKFFKTRMKYILFIMVMFGTLLAVFPTWQMFVALPLVFFFGYKLPYYNLIQLKNKEDLMRQFIFPEFLITFISLIRKEGNVYSILVSCLDYMDDPFKEQLQKLIDDIDENRTDTREAFMNFAKYIGTPEANNIMNTIHSFEESGIVQADLERFETLIMKMESDRKEREIERRTSLMLHLHSNPIIMYVMFYIMGLVYVIWTSTVSAINF